MRHWISTLLVVGMGCLLAPEQAIACTCGAAPLLSPTRMNLTTVDATVVRYLNNVDPFPDFEGSMELAVSKVFQGKVSSDTVVVYLGRGDGLTCLPDVHSYSIGSRYLLSFYQSGKKPLRASVVPCSHN